MTRRQRDREKLEWAAMRALIDGGSYKAAAKELHYSEAHVRRLVRAYCERYGYQSVIQAAFHYGVDAHFEHV